MTSIYNLSPVYTENIIKVKNEKRKVVLFLWMLSKEYNGKFIGKYGLFNWTDR